MRRQAFGDSAFNRSCESSRAPIFDLAFGRIWRQGKKAQCLEQRVLVGVQQIQQAKGGIWRRWWPLRKQVAQARRERVVPGAQGCERAKPELRLGRSSRPRPVAKSSSVGALDRRPRHEEHYHEA
jgi:hypothetical protein